MTRYYLTSGAGPDLPTATYYGGWDQIVTGAPTSPLLVSKTKAGAAGANNITDTFTTNNIHVVTRRLAIEDVVQRSGVLSGSISWCWAWSETSTSANAYPIVFGHIMAADGSNRGTLFSYAATVELTTTYTGLAVTLTMSSVSVQPGDRLVFETGAEFRNTSATSFSARYVAGIATGTDLTNGYNNTAFDRAGWVDLPSAWDDLLVPLPPADDAMISFF